MRRRLPLIFVFTLLAASVACVKLPRQNLSSGSQTAPPALQSGAANMPPVNINTASSEELEKLPGIGRGLAERIIEYRTLYGRFRRTEHLMMVRGISERRFRAMQALITAG
jgi:competence ComEA-like helix-hairpin-helix protein